jgi:hypothetical protein
LRVQGFEPSSHDLEIAGHKLVEDCFDSAAEGVVAAEEGGFVRELGGGGFAGSVIGAAGGGRFKYVKSKAESLKGTADVRIY